MIENKKILIVGGSAGIGLALARLLLERGACVVIASRNREKLADAEKELGGNVSTEIVDASDEHSVTALFRRVGSFEHLAVTIKPSHIVSPFGHGAVSDLRAAFETKFWGQYHLTRHCLPHISENGSITLTSGIASHRGYRGFSGTAAINGAVESFVTSVAGEIAPVRINAVCPGFIETEEAHAQRYASIKSLGANPPLGRLGTRDEAARAYLYLMNSAYTTGTGIIVDGGALSV